MQNKFHETEQAIEHLFLWINDKHIGENIRFIYGMTDRMSEILSEIKQCYSDTVGDEITSRVFDQLEMDDPIIDSDLEHTARKFLHDVDMSDRQKVIDQLTDFYPGRLN